MKNLKKLMAALLALCMVLSLAAPVFAAELPFTDVSEKDWSYDYIVYAYENGLMQGDSATTFNPQQTANRAMFATILWRVEGKPETYSENPFTDLTEDWYVDPVIWAFETGVTQGTSTTTYGPYDELQREQLATMLYRYVGNKGIETTETADLASFPDAAKVSDWALDAMKWAVAVGLVSGDDRGGVLYLDPQGDATREQLATILTRFVKAYSAGTEKNPMLLLETELTVTIAAGQTMYFQGHFNGMELTVTGAEGIVIEHNGEKYEDENGVAGAALSSSSPRMPVVFSITNTTGAAEDYAIAITYPVGSRENPEALMGLAALECSLVEGDTDGYYYSYNCRGDGTVVLRAENYDPAKYDVILMSSGSYAVRLMSESEDGTVSMDVASGDEIIIQVVAVPDEQWNYPELQVELTGEYLSVAGSMDNPAKLVLGENTASIAAGNAMGYWYTWTAEASGELSVTMNTESGWTYQVLNNTTSVMTDTHWFDDEEVVASDSVAVSAGDEVRVMVNTYDPNNMWSNPEGSITITAAFTAGEGPSENPGEDPDEPVVKEAYIVNYDVQLALGENTLTLDKTAETTVYEFCPEEAGQYSFTADSDDAKVGYWGAGSFFVSDQTENKTNTLVYNLTNAGPSIMVGVSGVESCTLTVTRVGEAVVEPVVETVVYENTVTPVAYSLTLGEDQELVYVDVTDDQADAAVLGEDGYYHLNTADGPVLLADLNNATSSLVGAMSYGQTKAAVYDEDGKVTQIVDYYAALEAYTACMDQAKSVYPLTADLMQMLKHLGSTKGWYDDDVLGFYLFGDVTVDPDTAWLFACCYVE